MRKCFYLSSMVILLVFAFVVSAKAAFTGSYAYFDWSNFKVQGYSLTQGQPAPTITWLDQSEEIYLENQNIVYWDYADDWDTGLKYSINTPQANVMAMVSNTFAESKTDIHRSGNGNSSSGKYGDFRVKGEGIIIFSIPYHIEVKIESDPLLENAEGVADVWLEVYNSDQSRYSYSDSMLDKSLSKDGTGFWSDDGVISVVLYFKDGEKGHFEAWIGTDASQTLAPIPSSFLLIGSGIGMVFIRRRKKV